MRRYGGMGIAIVALAGCAAASSSRGAPMSRAEVISEALPAQARFAPANPAADVYADAVAMPPRDALDEQLLATLQERSVAARPMHFDEALSRACAELAAAEPDDRGFSTGLVEFALHRHGIVEPSPRIFIVSGDPARPEALVAGLRAKLEDKDFYAPVLRVGIGVGPMRDGVAPVVVAVLGTRISIAPIPRAPRTGAQIPLAVTINERLRTPQLAVFHEDGSIERHPLGPQTTLACGDVPEEMHVDISALHGAGPTTVASFPVWCGLSPPMEYRWERAAITDGADDPTQLERRLVALVNRDRRAAGVPPFVSDLESTNAARKHVRDRIEAGAKVRTPAVPGSAYSAITALDLRAAYEALANGIAGREHLLAVTSTHVGVGVARNTDGALIITVIYRRVPPAINTDAAAREITARITAWTDVEAYPPLVAIARRFADELVAGVPQPEAWQDMRWWLQDIRWRFAYFNYGLAYVPTLASTTRDALVGPRTIHAFGVAVRQADHPRFGPRTIWIVVVYGERK